ncbi:MAG: cytochrome c biogenesis protein CcsA [Pseudomonadota bacterium]|nr:cytochrome c biogenesis protein CcsA [Pseudomonadota bacterium]
MANLPLYLLTALLYAALGIRFWQGDHAVSPGSVRAKILHLVVLIPLIAHALLLYRTIETPTGFNLGFGETLSIIVWLTVFIYWLANFTHELEGFQAIVFPVATICILVPLIWPSHHIIPHTGLLYLKLHLLIAFLAYSLFTIAAWHALIITIAERGLHGGRLPRVFSHLPPLLSMEKLLFRLITSGFALLTLAVLSGMLFSEELFGKPLELNKNTVFASLSWFIFAILLTGRHFYGWRGRTATRFTLIGSFMLVLAYLGSRFVLDVLLHHVSS